MAIHKQYMPSMRSQRSMHCSLCLTPVLFCRIERSFPSLDVIQSHSRAVADLCALPPLNAAQLVNKSVGWPLWPTHTTRPTDCGLWHTSKRHSLVEQVKGPAQWSVASWPLATLTDRHIDIDIADTGIGLAHIQSEWRLCRLESMCCRKHYRNTNSITQTYGRRRRANTNTTDCTALVIALMIALVVHDITIESMANVGYIALLLSVCLHVDVDVTSNSWFSVQTKSSHFSRASLQSIWLSLA